MSGAPIDLPELGVESQPALWEQLDELYMQHKDTINKYATFDVKRSGGAQAVDALFGGFGEAMSAVLEGLELLGSIHPAAGAAVLAFRVVVSLDLKRKENDKKVLVVKAQMLSMICAFFQLHELKEPPQTGHAKESLARLADQIAVEIKDCGNSFDYYSKKSTLSKYARAYGYEKRFSKHIEKLASLRDELKLELLLYLGRKQEELGNKMDKMSSQVAELKDEFWKAFRSPREIGVLTFIKDQGGSVETCIENENIFSKLLLQTGEDLYKDAPRAKNERIAMLKELKEDMGDEFRNNMTWFEGKFKLQSESLQAFMKSYFEQFGGALQNNNRQLEDLNVSIRELARRAYETIDDHEMQTIWKTMGLGTSVSAQQFILTIRDHFEVGANSNLSTAHQSPSHINIFLEGEGNSLGLENSNDLGQSLKPPVIINSMLFHDQDREAQKYIRWALQYLDASHFQQIMEAIDEDGSGFISIKEANKFSQTKPKHWSLLQWFAYWAAGQEIVTLSYQAKIHGILKHMHTIVDLVLPANRSILDNYLDSPVLHHSEVLLKSIKTISTEVSDARLKKLAEEYTLNRQKTILRSLKKVHYLIDTEQTLALILDQTQGRIEINILPLIYLLLRQHLSIFELSYKRHMHCDVMGIHLISFDIIFSIFDKRMKQLEAIFQQTGRDPEAQFQTYASGMFYEYYKVLFKDTEVITPFRYSVLFGNTDSPLDIPDSSDKEDGKEVNTELVEPGEKTEQSLLQYPEEQPANFENDDHRWISVDNLCPLEGYWSGTYKNASSEGLLFWAIGNVVDSVDGIHALSGRVEKLFFKTTNLNFGTMDAKCFPGETSETISIRVTFTPDIKERSVSLHFFGTCNLALHTMAGHLCSQWMKPLKTLNPFNS